MLMKNTNSKSALAGAAFLGLVLLPAAVLGGPAWLAAGILGLVVAGFSVTLRQPKLAPVRICAQKGRN